MGKTSSDLLSIGLALRKVFYANPNKIITPLVTQTEQPAKLLIKPLPPPKLTPSKVPSTRVGRLWNYGVLASGVGAGLASEALKRAVGISSNQRSSLALSPANVDRIVNSLTRMRGAALKLGQMLSIQDHSILSPEIERILLKVQNNANYMPSSQLQGIMRSQLGPTWETDHFSHFNHIPIAAASIGQVHSATLKSGLCVAVKIQYPGVAASISSDLDNLKTLILLGDFLPKGLYLDNTIRVARKELLIECDYIQELAHMQTFHKLISGNPELSAYFRVPKPIPELSTPSVLISEFVPGVPLGTIIDLPLAYKNRLAKMMLKLTLTELFEWRIMQTDPNWSNFLYDVEEDRVSLIDFGATREFGERFVKGYYQLIKCASQEDYQGCVKWSVEMGFLTGLESKTMTNAHVSSLIQLSKPFSPTQTTPYDFSKSEDVTDAVKSNIPTMLRERLTPPPDETYSLHRKLSGLFLLCSKLGVQVDCASEFKRISQKINK